MIATFLALFLMLVELNSTGYVMNSSDKFLFLLILAIADTYSCSSFPARCGVAWLDHENKTTAKQPATLSVNIHQVNQIDLTCKSIIEILLDDIAMYLHLDLNIALPPINYNVFDLLGC